MRKINLRSPLFLLDTSAHKFPITQSRFKYIRSALKQMRDITHGFLDKYREAAAFAGNDLSLEPIGRIIEGCLSVKRVELGKKSEIEIIEDFDRHSRHIFANIRLNDFQRLFSNLLNNAIESMDSRTGSIVVSIREDGTNIKVSIEDNGRGMPQEVVARLGEKGFTHGKDRGNGLGVFQAITAVKEMGGSLQFESEIGSGTKAVLNLPKVSPPAWFILHISLYKEKHIIILDDQQIIHDAWDRVAKRNEIPPTFTQLSNPSIV